MSEPVVLHVHNRSTMIDDEEEEDHDYDYTIGGKGRIEHQKHEYDQKQNRLTPPQHNHNTEEYNHFEWEHLYGDENGDAVHKNYHEGTPTTPTPVHHHHHHHQQDHQPHETIFLFDF